jgi:hypothetical protein
MRVSPFLRFVELIGMMDIGPLMIERTAQLVNNNFVGCASCARFASVLPRCNVQRGRWRPLRPGASGRSVGQT